MHDPEPDPPVERLLELDLITRDLARRPEVESAVIVTAAVEGRSRILSAGRPDDGAARAVHWLSSPVSLPGGHGALLCVGLAAWPVTTADDLPWIVESYARLASLWLNERRGVPLAAARDATTGCLSYAGLLDRLGRDLERCRRHRLSLTCCFASLEHDGGDVPLEVLARVGETLRGAFDADAGVGRYGRERFIVLLPDADAEQTAAATPRILAAIRAAAGTDACVGVVEWRRGTGPDRLLGDADRALTAAQARQRGRAPTPA